MEPVSLLVDGPDDIRRTADFASGQAGLVGFPPTDCADIALVTAELASNLVRHASGGSLRFSRIEQSGKVGIQIESEDSGPGIADLEEAVADGYSTGGGLGVGLGTVNRLTDVLEAYSRPGRGVYILCQKWIRPKTTGICGQSLSFGVATRAYRGARENGDAFVIKQWERHAIAGVIDGLGHGQFAHRASQTARQYVQHHFDQPLESLFRGTGRACRGTRGVVMALARFDLDQRNVTIGSVGDVEVRLIGGPERFNLIVRRGIIGLNAPSPVLSDYPWTSENILVMHSDGLRSHWALDGSEDIGRVPPDIIARRLLQELGKRDDDATVIVARNSEP